MHSESLENIKIYRLFPLNLLLSSLLWALQFKFNCGTYAVVQISSFKLRMDSQCIQARSSKNISVQNVREDFHIYIAGQTDTLKKKFKMMFCAVIWIWMSLLSYQNLNSSSKLLVLKRLLGFMLAYFSQKMKWYSLPKKVFLIIFHRNTAHLQDMSCCHKHQQQRYHNENTKICMFIHCMYVDILFPLTKAVPIMFGRVTTHYQTLRKWIDHSSMRYHNFNMLPHALPYISLIFTWFRAMCNGLARVTVKFIQKMYISIFLQNSRQPLATRCK